MTHGIKNGNENYSRKERNVRQGNKHYLGIELRKPRKAQSCVCRGKEPKSGLALQDAREMTGSTQVQQKAGLRPQRVV